MTPAKAGLAIALGVVVGLSLHVFLAFVSWVLWRASMSVMLPWDLPETFTKPDFLPFLCFWVLVAGNLAAVRNIWRTK